MNEPPIAYPSGPPSGREPAAIGIDPGVSGCIAVLDSAGRYRAHLHMPAIRDGKRQRVNAAHVVRFLREQLTVDGALYALDADPRPAPCRPVPVILERVGAMPGQGTASMFSFGHSAGVIEGIVTALGLPLTLATPQAWKRTAGLIGTDKGASLVVAARWFPDAPLTRKKDVALADALLIARHGYRALRVDRT